ncbi:MAG: phage holin family protein [Defluviitaleaceae bacterium]|nr:phage holin family protein [Defluviitaleaceae bacterium]
MDFMEYIEPWAFVIIPVLNVFGVGFKKTLKIADSLIIWLLIAIGVFLSMLWVLGASTADGGIDNLLLAAFAGITQGVLSAGVAITISQAVKQIKKGD